MNLSVSITTPEVLITAPLGLLEGTFEEKLNKAKAMGYDGIELLTAEPDKLDQKYIKKALKERGLKAAAVASGCVGLARKLFLVSGDENIRAEAQELLLSMIDFAKAVEAKVVTIGGFKGKAEMAGSTTAALEYLTGALSRADEYARNKGIYVVLEPLNPLEAEYLNTCSEVAEYIEKNGWSHIRLLVDTYHIYMNNEDPEVLFNEYFGMIKHVHISDSERLPAGKGLFDFEGFEEVLNKAGYEGWQSAELKREPDPDGNAKVTAETMKRI